jgi:hypothetical protein
MRVWRPVRLSRRLLLAAPLAVVAVLVAKPAQAKPRKTYECAADLQQEA